jgi:FlaA1/EpsC-like NDP-sugar epimerase
MRPGGIAARDELAPPIKAVLAVGVVSAAFAVAYLLRFDFAPVGDDRTRLWPGLAIAVAAKVFALGWFGLLGNWWWRYVGIPDLLRIAEAVSVASALTAGATLALVDGFPRSVFAIDWALSLVALAGLTATSRVVRESDAGRRGRRGGRRALVIGAGEAGVRVVRELRRNPGLQLRPVGFVDDDPAKAGAFVQGLRVVGSRRDLAALVGRLRVQEIVVAIPSAGRQAIRAIIDACKTAAVPVRIVPSTRDLLAEDPERPRLRPVQIDDLLGRAAVRLEREPVAHTLRGRVVLVTGAGGSIGSELCRQIAACEPATLVLLDRYENTLYYLVRELAERCPGLRTVAVVADVRDRRRVGEAMAAHRPAVVFHAAAHKHVPLMEENPGEAVRNNVGGTRAIAELAITHGVERVVLVSTDKAIRPTSVMGCTKRVAELLVQALDAREATRFVTVRFGNVLGSEGSVVPLLARQIARGGPVTITHPDAVRYFMLIPEAVHLVLHAATLGTGGEIFHLDMGEPVRVLDLAVDMIRLSGYRPYEDIDIRFTGLRPGEKLAETLRDVDETLVPTAHPSLCMLRSTHPQAWAAIEPGLASLETAADAGDAGAVRACLKQLVPEYSGVRAGDMAIVARPRAVPALVAGRRSA